MIKRRGAGYKVISHTKGELSKKPKSLQGAIDQLYAIEKSKQRRGEIGLGEVRRVVAAGAHGAKGSNKSGKRRKKSKG